MQSIFIILFSLLSLNGVDKVPSKTYMVNKVNGIRANGCYCGNKYYKPAPPVSWNYKLKKSAQRHAAQMEKYNFFSHESLSGKDIGERISKTGYNWVAVGENLGVGQRTFDEVLDDWVESKSHCRMLMNPKVNEMAVAKSGRYWVQHFGKENK